MTIYIVNNGNAHAVDDCVGNVWNDGYPSGGNYWDDYLGWDLDRNGIGDITYTIPGWSRVDEDRYPLMGPYPDPYNNNQQSNPQNR